MQSFVSFVEGHKINTAREFHIDFFFIVLVPQLSLPCKATMNNLYSCPPHVANHNQLDVRLET
jgi:hypothetical protein